MDKREVIYYSDELHDEFSTAVITPKRIDENFVYDRHGPFRAVSRFFWYRVIATPLAFLYVKLSLHQKTVGKEKLKPYKKTGIYLYGNHTQAVGDPLTPNVFCFPKRVSFIVHPNNVSMPVLGKINPTLGAIPLPDTLGAYKNFSECLKGRIERRHAVVIYPEAHIWPYYTKIRNFPDTSFGYPAKADTPVFCFVNTYQKRKRGKKPKMVTYVEGPFFPDMTKSVRERTKLLRDEVYSAMTRLAENSDVEVIKYIKKDAEASERSE
ncbi:MAG: hypothetical protein IJS45_03110 [Clostridia bacterium]|nr:hypothetical protein [Clostridia bacterium]